MTDTSELRDLATGPMSMNPEHVDICNLLLRAAEEIERLRACLREAMAVRHFCDVECSDPYDVPRRDPYDYDDYLKRWAEALGQRVESDWPHPGEKLSARDGGEWRET